MSELIYGVCTNDSTYHVYEKRDASNSNKITWRCPFYRKWLSMLSRVYGETYLVKYPSYKDVKVCDEWLVFSNFKAWMEKQDWEGKHLDKDLLGDGKLYSPETCCFLPPKINVFLADSVYKKRDLPTGVYLYKGRRKYQVRCRDRDKKKWVNLGYYADPQEAHGVWKAYKHKTALKYAKEVNDIRVKQALETRYL